LRINTSEVLGYLAMPERDSQHRCGVSAGQLAAYLYICLALCSVSFPQSRSELTGVIVTPNNEAVEGATVILSGTLEKQRTVSDANGNFCLPLPSGPFTLRVEGKYISPQERSFSPGNSVANLTFMVNFLIPPVHESLVIEATALDPSIDRRNDVVYKSTLFSRDDQVLQTLDAGINAGQHEGGGKSLEIRRFGFNLDHGGVNGGLKVLVDDVQQNQGTQGHGQGYLGQLKSLTPELVQDVNILNGPFSPEYGDFSGLGVVHIHLKESLPDRTTLRLQGGSFGSFRTFLAYSPQLENADSFIAYEGSRTDGPFLNPLRYKRDNVTSKYTWKMNESEALGFKLNLGRNDFYSSGQIPLDEVSAGRLDRFGFIDPEDGGRVRSATLGTYYRKEWKTGGILKLDGFVARSLFDLYSNFTFFLNDVVNGDGIQQHDSRLQEGANTQYLHPFKIAGRHALLVGGTNFHANQINVGLYLRVMRNLIGVTTRANVHVTNGAGYLQQSVDFWNGRLQINGGLRYDYFQYNGADRIDPLLSGVQDASRVQPKANLALTPSSRLPFTLHLNYGRGISSQDARGVVQRPSAPRLSTTDFYQAGTSHNWRRFSLSTDMFLIDRSNEQVYIPDDGSLEFKGPSRSYGFEAKTSVQLTRHLAFNGGITKVTNAFYRGTFPRVYVDSAPHEVSNAGLTMAGWKGFTGSLRFRHIGNYRLDGENASIRASGLTVLDYGMAKQLRRWVDFNLSVDNLTNKTYYETQNYFESRLSPQDPIVARIHGTPGYPITVTVGLTFRPSSK
jgi:outer membrane receptor protein involved in Fe transport